MSWFYFFAPDTQTPYKAKFQRLVNSKTQPIPSCGFFLITLLIIYDPQITIALGFQTGWLPCSLHECLI